MQQAYAHSGQRADGLYLYLKAAATGIQMICKSPLKRFFACKWSAREQIRAYAQSSWYSSLAFGNPGFASDEHRSGKQPVLVVLP